MPNEEYAYIFVRQDISKEQQLIQFGHVACVLGKNLGDTCPHKLNFVGIGVPDERGLIEALLKMENNKVQYHVFSEPDMNDELTAVASGPISGELRNLFSKYATLRFES